MSSSTHDRPIIDLAGRWSAEPLARTEFAGGMDAPVAGSPGRVARSKPPAAPPGGGTTILRESLDDLPLPFETHVPSNWHRAGLPGFHGRVAFSRELPVRTGTGWWLVLEGVDYLAEVKFDDEVAVRHEGAFDGFSVRVPDSAASVTIVVDAPREEYGSLWPYRKRQIKGIWTQWEPLEPFQASTGGIWGAVTLEQRPDVFIESVSTTTFLVPVPLVEELAYVRSGETAARVLIEVEVRSVGDGQARLVAELCGLSAERDVLLSPGLTRHRLTFQVEDPQLWWPWDHGNPTLHDLVVRVGDDELRRRVGLRETTFDLASGEFTINGRAIRLRGSNVIGDKWLSQYTEERARADVDLAIGANLNALRCCVHVSTEAFYRACDEAGMLVIQDMPLQWDYLLDDEVITQAADQVERIVSRLHDHASVVLWCGHNEPFPADFAQFAGPIRRAVQRADASRPYLAKSDFEHHVYYGWFFGHHRQFQGPAHAALASEFGTPSLPNREECEELGMVGWPPRGRDWSAALAELTPPLDVAGFAMPRSLDELIEISQRYQAVVAKTSIEAYRLQGVQFFHFALTDGWPGVSWSVVSYRRVPKLAYDAVRIACQPVLIGADISRDHASDAWDSRRFPILGSVWVVNDTTQDLFGCRWEATLGGRPVESGEFDVPAQGTVRWTPPNERWPLWSPPMLEDGEHQLALTLWSSTGEMISLNSYTITMLNRRLPLALQFET